MGKLPRQPQTIRNIAQAFIDLQTERHVADYDNRREWSQTEVVQILVKAIIVFDGWQAIRTEPEAGTYLLAMLLGKPR